MRPGKLGNIELETLSAEPFPELSWHVDDERYTLLAALRRLRIASVHLHHVQHFSLRLASLLCELGVPRDFTLHPELVDYLESSAAAAWQVPFATMLSGARRASVAAQANRERLHRLFPQARILVLPPLHDYAELPPPAVPEDDEPLVSVFSPAHNHASVLEEMLDSVQNQDYPRIEHLVLDDGSSDQTPEILRKYDGRLRWESHANIGEIRTLNKGLAMLSGEFVMILNDDDTIEPDCISASVEFMRRRPEVLACYPDFMFIDERSQLMDREVIRRDFDYAQSIVTWACLPGPAHMLRRRALELEPHRDTRYEHVGDMEYWFRLGLHGPLARVPQLLASHRTHSRSKQVYDSCQVDQQLLQLSREFFQRPGVPSSIRKLRGRARSTAHFYAALRRPERSPARLGHLVCSLALAPRHGGKLVSSVYPFAPRAAAGRSCRLLLRGLRRVARACGAGYVKRGLLRWLGRTGQPIPDQGEANPSAVAHKKAA